MIEKTFYKEYHIHGNGPSRATLARVAKRMLAEFKEAFGYDAGEELQVVATKIRECEDSEEYEYEYSYDEGRDSKSVFDNAHYSYEARAYAHWTTDEYCDPIYAVRWYFFSTECYTKRIGGKTIYAGSYGQILRKGISEKGVYRYFCTHRPPSGGCVPSGFISYDTYKYGERYLGEVTYNAPPNNEELQRWGLVIDHDWTSMREAFLGTDK